LGEIRLGEMGLGEMGLGEMGQNRCISHIGDLVNETPRTSRTPYNLYQSI